MLQRRLALVMPLSPRSAAPQHSSGQAQVPFVCVKLPSLSCRVDVNSSGGA
ncbi:hypothetical protein PF010_g18048 [Phytophthora fragariae]|uniref:Uncharacterized protein n=2 Tax=Phytophthora TaxID=4783 RepID=A0A6G0RN32_9STRA|nr:hypothetical protein PR001_g11926 [Phytophthora rubi]KAE9091815.1 hypothetical protein PF010_g18048 [Phytophthora fragariae]KAE9031611.1 hypothetical protein PR002_g9608 [Phytophthora rubi]KAE9205685.1 hypothetical protein PF004_g17517 [Phytophthora fragariae]KAE9337718.1 hypothetical protein PF008_g12392 [Phytophthora fragariae]